MKSIIFSLLLLLSFNVFSQDLSLIQTDLLINSFKENNDHLKSMGFTLMDAKEKDNFLRFDYYLKVEDKDCLTSIYYSNESLKAKRLIVVSNLSQIIISYIADAAINSYPSIKDETGKYDNVYYINSSKMMTTKFNNPYTTIMIVED